MVFDLFGYTNEHEVLLYQERYNFTILYYVVVYLKGLAILEMGAFLSHHP